MNPTLELIHRHASVRNYKPDPVPTEVIETIIAAAQRTSTSSNLHMWSVVAVTDAGARTQLTRLCGNQEHVTQAPVFMVWCADLRRLDRVCELRGYTQVAEYVENFVLAAVDCTLASQTAALAAESLGLGICYIGGIRNQPQQVIDLLALPRHVFPITGMTMGWPAAAPALRPRLPLEAVLHWGTYNQDQDQALREYDRTMLQTGVYQGRQVHVPRKADEMEDYGWLEHSARRVSQPWRTFLRQALTQQGFELK